MSEYFIHLAILCGISVILVQGFHVSFGLGRSLNLAHVASYAVGAYVTALGVVEYNFSLWKSLSASVALTALFALLIGRISLKLRDDYFAVGTLAFHSVVIAVLINWRSVTRGVLGIPGISRPEFFADRPLDTNSEFGLLVLAALAVSTLFTGWVTYSNLGRKLRAQAENPAAASALGIRVHAVQNDAFIISSACAGLAGSLLAYYMSYIDPTMFHLGEMIFVLSAVVIGRPGSFIGAMVGTVVLVLLPEPLRFIDIPSHILGPMRQLLHAVILFGAVYVNRRVLFPHVRRV